MDAGAFVQENKRWLIGCAIGGLCWWIGAGVIGSIFPAGDGLGRRGNQLTAAYDQSALTQAQEQEQVLTAERARLEAELSFTIAKAYGEWSDTADKHLFVSGANLKQRIVDDASDRDVVVDDADLTWDTPAGVDRIRRVLYGLDMIDAIQQRLFAAHDAVLAADEDAAGLSAILSVKLESDRSRGSSRLRRGRGGKRGGVDLQDLMQEQKVQLQFQADERTIKRFLEACRAPGRTLVVDKWQQLQPSRPGEPCTVKATLCGISFTKQEDERP